VKKSGFPAAKNSFQPSLAETADDLVGEDCSEDSILSLDFGVAYWTALQL